MPPANGRHMSRRGTVVVKAGTSSVTKAVHPNAYVQLDLETIDNIAHGVAELHERGYGVIVVLSGAVAAGMAELKVRVSERKRIKNLQDLRSYAGVGQPILMEHLRAAFGQYGITISQSLTERTAYHDSEHRKDMVSLRRHDLRKGFTVIVNGNDPVTKAELRMGDNDFTAAHEAIMVGAKHVVFLTDQQGIILPVNMQRPEGKKELVEIIDFLFPEMFEHLGVESALGTGGVGTKLMLMDLLRRSNVRPVMAHKREANNLLGIIKGEVIATRMPLLGKTLLPASVACDVLDAIARHGTNMRVDDYFADLTSLAIDRIASREPQASATR